MSRHFSYEIDERRVRTLLTGNSLPLVEREWETYSKESKTIQSLPKLPSVSLPSFAISKGVFLTVVFILLVTSFTWFIARFVDFSSLKSNSETVREVKPEPENVQLPAKKPENTPPVEINTTLTAKKDSIKAINNLPTDGSLAALPQNSTLSPDKNFSKTKQQQIQSVPKTPVLKDSTFKINRKNSKKQVEPMEAKPISTEIPSTPQQEPKLEPN
jgi:hypothetical protein